MERKILIGAFLLIDGRFNSSTLEMMQEESAISCIVDCIGNKPSENIRLRRIFLELMYELCRVQKLRMQDLDVIDFQFIAQLYKSMEERDDYDHDPYGYAVIKVLLALNEQYMVASYDLSIKQDPDFPLRRATSTPLPDNENDSSAALIRNKVFETLIQHRDKFRSVGENIVFLLNRSPDDCLQLMALKFLYLIFTSSETFDFLYLNDLKVIVDVFIRELCDLSFEQERLIHSYLRVLHPLLQNTELRKEEYKRDELVSTLENMSENAGRSLVDISETTQRLAFRCLFVEWLNHPGACSERARSFGLENANTKPENEQALSNNSTTSVSSDGTRSPNSLDSPISPISSNSFSVLSLEESPLQATHSSGPAPPPPPPSRTARSHEKAHKRAHRAVPPPAVPVSRPPPLPMPRKKSAIFNMSIANTSAMDLANSCADKDTRNHSHTQTRRSSSSASSSTSKELPPLPSMPPTPPRPRMSQAHSYF